MSKSLALILVALLVAIPLIALWLIRENWPENRSEKATHSNNLKQIGCALHDYHQYSGSFPLGTIANPSLTPTKRLSWIVEVLPFLEHDDLYQLIDRSKAWDADENLKAVNTGICPVTCSYESSLARYVGIAGVGVDAPKLPISDPRVGVFGYDRKTKLGDIADGTAFTAMVVQTDQEIGPWAAGGPSTVRGIDTDRKPYVGLGCQFGGIIRGKVCILMADGSVRWVKDSIDPATFEALATIAGGEKVELPTDY